MLLCSLTLTNVHVFTNVHQYSKCQMNVHQCSGRHRLQQWLPSPPTIKKWQTKDRLPREGISIWHPRISTDLWWTEDVTSGYKPWEEWVWTEQGNQPWRRSAQVAMQYDFESHKQMTCHKIVSHHQMTCHSQTCHLFTCLIMTLAMPQIGGARRCSRRGGARCWAAQFSSFKV